MSFREAGNSVVMSLALSGMHPAAAKRDADPGGEGGNRSQRNHLAKCHPDRIRTQCVVAKEPVRIMVAVSAPALNGVGLARLNVSAEG